MILLGRPVIFAEDMTIATAPTNSTGNIMYGDFRGYLIIDRTGVEVIVDMFTELQNDVIVYYVDSRVGGGLRNYESIIVGDCTT